MPRHILWLLCSFNGRLGRLEYLAGWMGLSLSLPVLRLAVLALTHAIPHMFAAPLTAAFDLGVTWMSFSLDAKRFRDFDWNGWWALAPSAVALGLVAFWVFGGSFAALTNSWGAGSTFVGLILLTLTCSALFAAVRLMLLLRPGTPGANAFGPRSGAPDLDPSDTYPSRRSLDDPTAAPTRRDPRPGVAAFAAAMPPTFGRRRAS